MFKKTILLVLLLCSFSAMAEKKTPKPEPIKEADGPTIGYKSVAEALAAVRKDPEAKEFMSGDWIVINVGKLGQPNYAQWNFSPSSYPAYPAVVKRTIYERDGEPVIDMDIACEARKSACEKMIREFMKMNETIRRGLAQAASQQ